MLVVYHILWEVFNCYLLVADIVFLLIWLLLPLGTVLGSLTFFGLYREHDSRFSLVVFIISLIFPWVLASSILLGFFLLAYSPITEILLIVGGLLIGVVYLLWGSVMLVLRKEFGQSEINLVAGIFFLLASPHFFAIYPFSSYYMIPACTAAIISLFQSEAFK